MLLKYPLILASNSPRRQKLLKELGFNFSIKTKETDESYPDSMEIAQIPVYLARKKAIAMENEAQRKIILTADTIVVLKEQVLDKPVSEKDARKILVWLSGKVHEVYSGYCILFNNNFYTGIDRTEVSFKQLKDKEIDHYVRTSPPFDKAGAYGIQEWIGMIGIEWIKGSYFNVVGLPVHKIFVQLEDLDLIVW